MAAMQWRPVAASTWTFKQYPLLKALEVIHLLGVTEVELWAEGTHLDPRGELPDLTEVASALDRLGLWPSGMHAPFKGLDLTVADDEERQNRIDVIKGALDVAAALDVMHVVVHVDGGTADAAALSEEDVGAQGSGRSQRLRTAAEALEQLCEYGLDLGVTVLIENQPDVTGARIGARVGELLELIKTVDMPNLGLCFDIPHAIVSTGAWEDEWQAAAASGLTASIHMSDTEGTDDDHLALGAGTIDWTRFLRALDESGGEPDLVLEVAGGEEAVQQSVATLARVIEETDV